MSSIGVPRIHRRPNSRAFCILLSWAKQCSLRANDLSTQMDSYPQAIGPEPRYDGRRKSVIAGNNTRMTTRMMSDPMKKSTLL